MTEGPDAVNLGDGKSLSHMALQTTMFLTFLSNTAPRWVQKYQILNRTLKLGASLIPRV